MSISVPDTVSHPNTGDLKGKMAMMGDSDVERAGHLSSFTANALFPVNNLILSGPYVSYCHNGNWISKRVPEKMTILKS